MDCGNGTFANLQQHVEPEELTAVVHHPRASRPLRRHLRAARAAAATASSARACRCTRPKGSRSSSRALVGDWGDTFDWHVVGDGDATDDRRRRRCGSRAPTTRRPRIAVEVAHDGKRLVYTSDTGPEWSVDAFGPGADLVLSEATYLHDDIRAPIHLSARQAGEAARDAGARRLMLTHLWPTLDPVASVEEGSEAFGERGRRSPRRTS